MDDLTVDRRNVLAMLGTTGVIGSLAGCSSDSDEDNNGGETNDEPDPDDTADSNNDDEGGETNDESESEESKSSDATDTVIFDTFEADNLFTEKGNWDLTTEERAASVNIVDRGSPDAGAKVLQLSDGRDPGAGPQRGLYAELTHSAPFSADPWTVTGQFYLESYPETDWDPAKSFISVAELDFVPGGLEDDEGRDMMHFVHETGSFGEETSSSAPRLEAGSWYDYEIVHDGDGGYTATRYKLDSGGNRTNEASISIQTEAPNQNANLELYAEGGQGARQEGENKIVIEHAYIRWESDL